MSEKSEPRDTETIPLFAEEVTVGKRQVETGKLSVTTQIEEQTVDVRQTLLRTSAQVERVPVGRVVATMPQVRELNDTVIIPIVEERLVVEKQLFFVEEVHVSRKFASAEIEQAVTRRVMTATVIRDGEVIEHILPTDDNKISE